MERWCPICKLLVSRSPCPKCGNDIFEVEEKRSLFFHLWGKAQESPVYVKRAWARLQELIGL